MSSASSPDSPLITIPNYMLLCWFLSLANGLKSCWSVLTLWECWSLWFSSAWGKCKALQFPLCLVLGMLCCFISSSLCPPCIICDSEILKSFGSFFTTLLGSSCFLISKQGRNHCISSENLPWIGTQKLLSIPLLTLWLLLCCQSLSQLLAMEVLQNIVCKDCLVRLMKTSDWLLDGNPLFMWRRTTHWSNLCPCHCSLQIQWA